MYDKDKDKLLYSSELKREKDSFQIFIFQYSNGKAKLQLSRMYEKNEGVLVYPKLGRLSLDEVIFLFECLPEIISVMKEKEKNP